MDSLIDRCLRDAAQVVGKIDKAGWAALSPCAGWTVRQAGNHLLGSVTVLVRIVEGDRIGPADFDPQLMADTDRLGADPSAAVRELADRAVALFGSPGILERRFDVPVRDASGHLIANIALLESLVHGWDVATGAGIAYQPDDDVVNTVRTFATVAVGDTQRQSGLFGPPLTTTTHTEPLAALLGHLGRRVG